MKIRKLLQLNLRLFEGGAGAGAGASGGEGTGEGAVSTGETNNTSVAEKNTRSKNPLANVVYGKQAEELEQSQVDNGNEPETIVTEKSVEERKAEFEKLIKGDYKDLFGERVQSIIDNRFKETKTLETQLQQLNPVLEMLSSKYGVDASDLESLSKAIEEDNSFYEQEAIDKGLTVEQLKEIKRIERENSELKRAAQERQAREQASKTYAEWMNQSESLKEFYPTFDLQTESQNEDFVKLLQNGIDVKTAYEVIHKDEIIGGAMQYTAQQVQQQVVNNIKARNSRPSENGLSSKGAVITKKDVNSLSRKDREEIERRVMRGEHIEF